MINFFRKTRYNLMEKNKTGKYLKYAIGEIVLVVVGILIALSINNWNEKRLEKIIEQEYLTNLKGDFEFNKTMLIEDIVYIEKIIKNGKLMLNFTGNKGKPETEKEMDSLLNWMVALPAYSPKFGFLDDLMNSGKLGIFRSAELKKLLSSYKPSYKITYDIHLMIIEHDNQTINLVNKNGSWLDADKNQRREFARQLPGSGFEMDNRILLMNLEFENLIEGKVFRTYQYLIQCKKELALCEEILRSLNEEIEG